MKIRERRECKNGEEKREMEESLKLGKDGKGKKKDDRRENTRLKEREKGRTGKGEG